MHAQFALSTNIAASIVAVTASAITWLRVDFELTVMPRVLNGELVSVAFMARVKAITAIIATEFTLKLNLV